MPELTFAELAAADTDAVVRLLAGRSEAERRALAPELLARYREVARDFDVRWEEREALRVAVLGCATLTELCRLREPPPADAAVAVLADRRPPWTADWLEHLLERLDDRTYGAGWRLARGLVHAGLVPRPDSDAYLTAMMAGVAPRGERHSETPVRDALMSDPALLEHELWRLFEVEGLGRTSLADVDKLHNDAWSEGLLALARDGVLDRGRLLDASLGALARDFPAYRAGWFSRFHEALEPTPGERAARVGAYLGLLASPIPSTVSFAVRALDRMPPDAIEPGAVGAALPGALGSRQKGTVLAPSARAAFDALTGAPPDDLDDLVARADALPADVRATLGLDAAVTAARAGRLDLDLPGLPARGEPVLYDPITPVAGLDELGDLLARLLAAGGSFEDFERALDGISRMCGSREPFDGRLEPLLSQATGNSQVWPLDRVIQAWVHGAVPELEGREPGTRALELLMARVEEVAVRAAAGEAAPLLAAPTHRGGWIDPRVLAERIAALDAPAGRFDLAQAVHRLPRGARAPVDVPPPARYRFRASVDAEWRRRVLVVRPDPSPHDAPVDQPTEWIPALLTPNGRGRDRALNGPLVRYAWPSGTEAYFAVAAMRQYADDGSCPLLEAEWMDPLLDPRTPVGPMTCLALVMAFGVLEKQRTVGAQDALSAAIAGGRVHPLRLGAALGWLVAEGLCPATRIGPALAAAAAESDLSAETVRLALEVALPQLGDDPPRDVHALLEPLNELAEQAGAAITDPAARAALAGFAGRSSKAGRLANALLGRTGESTRGAAAARDSLAVRVERGERWAALGS